MPRIFFWLLLRRKRHQGLLEHQIALLGKLLWPTVSALVQRRLWHTRMRQSRMTRQKVSNMGLRSGILLVAQC